MDDNLISIGWVALDENGNVNQPMTRKQWSTIGPTPSVRKLYKTEAVAKRYGTPKECFIKEQDDDTVQTGIGLPNEDRN